MGNPDPMRDPNREPTDHFDPASTPGPEPARRRSEPGAARPDRSVEGPSVPLREEPRVRGPFPSYARPARTSGKAVVSLLAAIAGLFIFPIILSVIAIIVGWAALTDIDRRPATGGRGLAIAGIVIGVIGLIIGIISVIVAASYNWLVVYLF